MTTNAGFLLIAGLGALLLFGQRKDVAAEETGEDLGLTTTVIGASSGVAVSGTAELDAFVAVENMGETITPTEFAVRRSEQINKQRFIQAANSGPSVSAGGLSQGDIDAIEIRQGTFVYGGAIRPTSTAKPRWNNKYGWWWMNPKTGNAVGPGGKEWSPNDTSVNMGSPGTNIGKVLPPGWTRNPGGSADFTGTQATRAYDIGF